MSYMKRAMALLLALAMSLCLVFSASAATSPTTAPTTAPTAAPAPAPAAPTVAENVTPASGTNTATLGAEIKRVGNGSVGAFRAAVKTVIVNSAQSEVVISKKAFKNSNVKTVKVNTRSIRIEKNAFQGTKAKNAVININGAKKAADVKVGKGSFNGLSKKAKIVVSKKSMNNKEFKKLKTKLKKTGFKGKIVRK